MRAFVRLNHTFMVSVALSFFTAQALCADLDNAPPPFPFEDATAVPIDIQAINLHLSFDVAAAKTVGRATIEFVPAADGYPFFDMVPTITAANLENDAIAPSDIPTIADPNGVTKLRVLKRKLNGGETYELTITYDLSAGVSYDGGVLKAGFFMTDLRVGGRGFWEQYGPANYEFDQFQQNITITILNSDRDYRVYSNARVTFPTNNEWVLMFPSYFTTSSIYLHIAAAGRFVEKKSVFHGLAAEVPVVVYGDNEASVDEGLSKALSVLAENENTFGPFSHAKALAYITPDGGGMEYGGATMTSMRALEHEFTHFWFARGVMPANGNAGWIDEAVASWRDRGYPRASSAPGGAAHNLGGFSPYRRHTTEDAYTIGRDLISAFDKQFEGFSLEGQTGMRAVLRSLFAERKKTTITVGFFKEFLERVTGADLTATFAKYVYGVNAVADGSRANAKAKSAYHPRPYTEAELNRYR